jgi:hypothetical protein
MYQTYFDGTRYGKLYQLQREILPLQPASTTVLNRNKHTNNNTMAKSAGSKSSTKASSKKASKASSAAAKSKSKGTGGKATKPTKDRTSVSPAKAIENTKKPATRKRAPTPVQSPESTNRSSITTEQPSIATRATAAPVGNVVYNDNRIDVDQAEDITATIGVEASARYQKKNEEDNARNQHLVSVKAVTKKQIYPYVSIVRMCRQGSTILV